MNCAEFKGCLNDSIDQELGSAEQAGFDAHRASCEACQAEYTAELAMLAGLRAMPMVGPPEGFADRVLANVYKSVVEQEAAPQQNHHRQRFVLGCAEFKDCLNDGIDQELDSAEQAGFDAHRASCEACQAVHTAELAMLAGLRAMPVTEPPEGFADRVLANVYKSAVEQKAPPQQNHHRQSFVLGFGSAAAAALAVWVVVGMSPGEMSGTGNGPEQIATNVETNKMVVEQPVVQQQQPVMSIAVNTERTIKLAFASSESLQGAKITIRLPENVALVGYPGRRQLSWETNLKKGDNLLSLPIVATQVAQGELIADIEYEGRVKTLTLSLDIGAEALPATSSVDSKFHLLIG